MKNLITKLVVKSNGEYIKCKIEGDDDVLSSVVAELLISNEAEGRFRDIFTEAVKAVAIHLEKKPAKKTRKKK